MRPKQSQSHALVPLVIGCDEVALNKKLQLGNVMIDTNKRMEI